MSTDRALTPKIRGECVQNHSWSESPGACTGRRLDGSRSGSAPASSSASSLSPAAVLLFVYEPLGHSRLRVFHDGLVLDGRESWVHTTRARRARVSHVHGSTGGVRRGLSWDNLVSNGSSPPPLVERERDVSESAMQKKGDRPGALMEELAQLHERARRSQIQSVEDSRARNVAAVRARQAGFTAREIADVLGVALQRAYGFEKKGRQGR